MIKIDIIFNLIQSLGAIATAITLIYMTIQIKLQKKDIEINLEYQKREKSLEMCRYYENLMDDIFDIHFLFQTHWKKSNIVANFIMEKFTKDEILKTHNEAEVEIMKDVPTEIMLENYFNKNLNLENIRVFNTFRDRNYKMFSNKDFEKNDNDKKILMKKLNTELLIQEVLVQNETDKKLNGVLNKLEFFAMSFISGIADERVVYQSLHQSFFTTIGFFYPRICSINSKGGKDKFYTNIIELYNIWKKREKEQEKVEEELQEVSVFSNKSNILN